MKGGILDRVVAAEREHRSVALATELASGRQMLFEGEQTDDEACLSLPGLGYPTTDEYAVTGGKRNDFVKGSIVWNQAKNTTTVTQK